MNKQEFLEFLNEQKEYRMIGLDEKYPSDFDRWQKDQADTYQRIIEWIEKEDSRTSEDNLQNNKCFIDWRGYGEDSEPYCEQCDMELFDDWNHCPSCGRKIYSYIDGKEIVGWP